MKITSIRNQDNRTNFNGWKRPKLYSPLISTDTTMDSEILGAIAKILPAQIKSKSPESLSRQIILQDGTSITYDLLRSHLKVVNTESRGILEQHSCYSWETIEGDAMGRGISGELSDAKNNILDVFVADISK